MMPPQLNSILYVEDDPHLRATAKLVLEVIGRFQVRECGTTREALNMAADFAPDLILLDQMLPDVDGLATLAMLRSLPHLTHTPAMFLTGCVSEEDHRRYKEAGVIGVIGKPLTPLRLSDQLRGLWEQHTAR